MKLIPLSAVRRTKHSGKYTTMVSDEDYEWAKQFNWTVDHSRNGRIYAIRRPWGEDGKKIKIYLHREIWERANGPLEKGQTVDHRNCRGIKGLDNRRPNLRLASYSQNIGNSRIRSDNTSGFKGVSKHRDKWVAYLNKGEKRICLGLYEAPELAAVAYDQAAIDYWGVFAKTNFDLARCI